MCHDAGVGQRTSLGELHLSVSTGTEEQIKEVKNHSELKKRHGTLRVKQAPPAVPVTYPDPVTFNDTRAIIDRPCLCGIQWRTAGRGFLVSAAVVPALHHCDLKFT